jgi:radical SAM superfamily enzyme YgiQ (UPF0313 family)
MVVRFEGEIPFKMICRKIADQNYDFSDVPNLTYRKNGEIKENHQIDLIKDISQMPKINRNYFEDKSKKLEDITHADIITARGCPYHCTFCDCTHYWSKKYRMRNLDVVIAELKELKSTYPNL